MKGFGCTEWPGENRDGEDFEDGGEDRGQSSPHGPPILDILDVHVVFSAPGRSPEARAEEHQSG